MRNVVKFHTDDQRASAAGLMLWIRQKYVAPESNPEHWYAVSATITLVRILEKPESRAI